MCGILMKAGKALLKMSLVKSFHHPSHRLRSSVRCRYFCRTALRLWIIDFLLHPRFRKKEKQRHEQPFLFCRFSRLPLKILLFAGLSERARVCVCELVKSKARFATRWSDTCVQHISQEMLCSGALCTKHYSYEFMKKIRFGFLCTLGLSSEGKVPSTQA